MGNPESAPSAPLPRTLFYFADPMCSWCWGFSPVMEAIVRTFPDLPVSIIVGGLRAGNDRPMESGLREEILHHWRDVQRRSGQPFVFDNALPDGFRYDTEPPCRAVVSMIALQRKAALAYFRDLQHAFYAEQQNIVDTDVLAERARVYGVDDNTFRAHFELEATRERTRRHFMFARETGVRGFPTVILGDARGTATLTQGFRTFDEVRPEIERWLADDSDARH